MTLKNQFMKRDYLIKMILNAMVKQPTFIKWTITSNCFSTNLLENFTSVYEHINSIAFVIKAL